MARTESLRPLGAPLLAAVLSICVMALLGPAPRVAAEEEPKPTAEEARRAYLEQNPWWALADPTYSRKQVRERLATYAGPDAGMLPGGPPPTHAWIRVLDRMIEEDAKHKPPPGPLDELPADERIAELIFRLRDVTGSSMFANGGPPDVFGIPGVDDPTAADLLAKEGLAAVPALIAALGDERLTRCVGDPRGGGHPMVWRIGEAAAKILERIAGRPFVPRYTKALTREFGLARRPAVEAWWAAVREKGEFLATADELATTTVPHMDVYLSQRLAALDAHAASPLIARVVRNSTDPLRRKILLDVLGPLEGPGARELLHRELEHGPFLLHRVTAAFWLRDQGEGERATAAMRKAWRERLDFGTHAHTQWARWTHRAGVHQIAAFLATSEDASVVATLGVGLDDKPAPVRAVVAQLLGGGKVEYRLMGYFGTYRHLAGIPTIDDAVARRLLRRLLDDLAPTGRNAHPWGAPLDSRVADLAAAALARREPGVFRFARSAKRAARDAAIAEMRTQLDASPKPR